MKNGFRLLFALALVSFPVSPAQASQTSPFVYNLKLGTGQGMGMNVSLAVDVRSMAADGTRVAKVTVKAPQMPPIDGKEVDASISPAGAITIASTGDMPQSYSPAQMKQASQAAMGPMIQMLINPLNTFAAGCAAAPLQNVGTSWHALSPEHIDVVFTIIGHQQIAGRDTLAIRMSSPSPGGPSYSGQGNYDTDAHLVVSLHSELHQSGQGGPSQVVDVAMTAP